MNQLDIEWFKTQEEAELAYDEFYNRRIVSVQISIVYVNNDTVVFIRHVQLPVYDNILKSSSIDELIMRHRILNNAKYKFQTMAKYNITITPKQILSCDYSSNYFTPINQMQDVRFSDTIACLDDVNELFVILSVCDKQLNTRRVRHKNAQKTRRKL